MTPKNLSNMLLPNPQLDKLARKHKGAKSAWDETQRYYNSLSITAFRIFRNMRPISDPSGC